MIIIRKIYSILFISFFLIPCFSQEIYQHISSKGIYTFIDEMANEKLIELNSTVKPYSRIFIAEKLEKISEFFELLNKRQRKELDFYLKDFNKELKPDKKFKKRVDILYYKDSLFTFSLNPILGIQYWNNENGSNYHRWNGAEIFAYVGKHLGVYASLRDNHENKNLSAPKYLNTRYGATYKGDSRDYSEMRGGITFSWKWGSIGLVKDHNEWGNNYHYPSIISAKAPSITQIKFNLKPAKWFEFNYFHGWLVSGIVDSARSYNITNSYGTNTREVFFNKYMAANLFTFKPFKGFYASFGNSVVYSADNVHPAYLIPVMFYKSIDHTLNNHRSYTGQNSQFFFDFSSRQVKHLHLYASFYYDDISFNRLKEQGRMGYYSLNTGFRLSNLIPNTSITFEYFQSYPLVYKHIITTTTYESNFYNIGHFMQDNSRSFYTEILFKPLRGLSLKVDYNFAQHGEDHTELGTDRHEVVNYFLDVVEWENNEFSFSANYQILNDIFIFGELRYRNVTGDVEKYTAEYYRDETTTFSVGMNWGF